MEVVLCRRTEMQIVAWIGRLGAAGAEGGSTVHSYGRSKQQNYSL
jgi:hypothetical protein